MSAKYIYNNLSDENPDLQKQIGCMHGIFHIFDRGHFLGGGRRSITQSQKRLPSGQKGNKGVEPNGASQNNAENANKKTSKEKQRNSTESSRTSFSSSSCSSSISSLERSKTYQPEPSSLSQANIPKTYPPNLPISQSNAPLILSQQALNLQGIVKDSLYRETRCISLKTATKEEARGQTLTYIDSPRPLHNPNTANPRVPGLKESFRVLHKLREAPYQFNEGKDGSSPCTLKDAGRFSFDGRESRETFKSTIKLKELPRLSLDSKASSPRCYTEKKSNYLLGDTGSQNGNSNSYLQQQELAGCKGPSSVVVRLMGLESLPDPISTNSSQARQIKTNTDVQSNPSDSTRTTEGNKQTRSSGSSSPRNPRKEPISPQPRDADSVKKPTKFPMEPAPWKQSDGSKGTQTPTPKSRSLTKATNSVSVYGEIEKRLAQLEFKSSGKDLRALKQILEAMQKTKDILQTRNEASESTTQRIHSSNLDQNPKLAYLQSLECSSTISLHAKGNSSPKSRKSPIVIMRPAKTTEKAKNPASLLKTAESLSSFDKLRNSASADARKESVENRTAKNLTPRIKHHREASFQPVSPLNNNIGARSRRVAQISKEPQLNTGESTKSGKSSNTLNLRWQHKQLGLERHSHPTTQPFDSNRNRRQPSRELAESRSPRRKVGSKSSKFQPCDDELSDISSEIRDLSHQGDVNSLHSESNHSLVSLGDEEVSSNDRSNKIKKTFIQKRQSKNQVAISTKDRSFVEQGIASSEQPSPVSVLDATFYSDELPSPIKKMSIAFRDDEALNSDVEWIPVDAEHLSGRAISSLAAIDNRNVESIQNLIQNIQKISSTAEPMNNETPTLYNIRNAEHKYILQILLTSGFLKDFEFGFANIYLCPTGNLINPDLFLALEQARANSGHISAEPNAIKIAQSETHARIRRQLLFDVVDEIVAYKLHSANSSYSLVGKRPKGLQLFGELCSEVDRLQGKSSNSSLENEDDGLGNILWDDLMRDSVQWIASHDEIPGIVLDVERLIFKDLISEVVAGEALSGQGQSARHSRQLFSQ